MDSQCDGQPSKISPQVWSSYMVNVMGLPNSPVYLDRGTYHDRINLTIFNIAMAHDMIFDICIYVPRFSHDFPICC